MQKHSVRKFPNGWGASWGREPLKVLKPTFWKFLTPLVCNEGLLEDIFPSRLNILEDLFPFRTGVREILIFCKAPRASNPLMV